MAATTRDAARLAGQPDINNLDLLSEPIQIDGSIDSEEFFQQPLPDDGRHTVRLSLGDRGIKVDRQRDASGNKTGNPYLLVHLVAKIQKDDGTDGLTIYDNPTSVNMPNMNTSRLAAILDIAGHPATGCNTLGALKEHAERALAQGPVCDVVSQWQADIEESNGKYRSVKKGQTGFPQRETGGYDPEIVDAKTGQTVRAQARIVKYLKSA